MTKVIQTLVRGGVISEREGRKLDAQLMTDPQVLADIIVGLNSRIDDLEERLEKMEGVVQP